MSRIGKLPIAIPDKVDVKIDGGKVSVKGPLGQLEHTFKGVSFKVEDKNVVVSPGSEEKAARAMWGTARALINNMVTGVSTGFTKILEINGVGYRAELKGSTLVLSLGFSHPVNYALPKAVTAEVDKKATTVTLKSIDKQVLGQVAAEIRAWRPPEPYKGKGVKYSDEQIRRKAGKAAK